MTEDLSLRLNALGLIAVSLVLAVAFADQLIYGDLPCPLCLLQRAGVILAGFGLALNLRFGARPSHYAMIILGAGAGAAIAVRQILLHIVPGTGTYGNAILGLHFYTWSLIVFALMVMGTAVMLLFDRQFDASRATTLPLKGFSLAAFLLFGAFVLGNVVSTVLECGAGLCPDNPTEYLLLK